MELLERVGTDAKDMLISNIYCGQKAQSCEETIFKYRESVEIRRGVRQGCTMPPLLFNL